MISLTNTEYKEITDFIAHKFGTLSKSELEILNWYLLDEYGDAWDEVYEEIGEGIGAYFSAAGASKVVFYFEEYPEYIFKIPFRGEACCYWDEKSKSYFVDSDDPELEFTQAWEEDLNPDNENDYCALESAVFQEAVKQGLDEFFAETTFLMNLDNIKIYISEYIANDADYVCYPVHISKESSKNAKAIHDNYFNPLLSYRILEVFCEQHGFEKTKALMDFVYFYNIGDLTGNNLRFTEDNVLFLTDYSDYRE